MQASVWSLFHGVRCSKHIHQAWEIYVGHFPTSLNESKFALQLILDRMLKRLIEAEAGQTRSESIARPLTETEINAIRYMAGYVAVSLLKKARKTSKNPALQIKRRLFVRVLQSMKAVQQPGEPDTLFEYSSHWCELIDRGGLYNISNNVFRLVQSIEMVVRQELNTQNYLPGNGLCAQIGEQVYK